VALQVEQLSRGHAPKRGRVESRSGARECIGLVHMISVMEVWQTCKCCMTNKARERLNPDWSKCLD